MNSSNSSEEANEIPPLYKLRPAGPLSRMPWPLFKRDELQLIKLKQDQYPPTAGTLVALIQVKDAVPHMIRLVQFWWRGPFKPWKLVHWQMLWGLDLFAGPVPIVKTMIALNVLFWIWIAVTRS